MLTYFQNNSALPWLITAMLLVTSVASRGMVLCGGHAGESTPHLELVHNDTSCSQHRPIPPCETDCSSQSAIGDEEHDHETDHEEECDDELVELTQTRPNQDGDLADALPAPITNHLFASETVFAQTLAPTFLTQRMTAIPPDEPVVLRSVCLII